MSPRGGRRAAWRAAGCAADRSSGGRAPEFPVVATPASRLPQSGKSRQRCARRRTTSPARTSTLRVDRDAGVATTEILPEGSLFLHAQIRRRKQTLVLIPRALDILPR